METNATQKNVVFKVKYGDKLKRINESVNCQQLDLSLDQLISKIRECFKITPDKGVNLTYIDEDGDTVLLGDDADLYDAAIKQGLNPLRIDIKLKRIPLSKNPPAKINPDHNHVVESLGKDVNPKVKTTSVKKSSAPSDKPSHGSSKQAQVEPILKHAKPNWSSVSDSSAPLDVSGNAFVGGEFALAASPVTGGQVEPLIVNHGVECYKFGVNSIIGTCYKSNSEENCNYCAHCFPRCAKYGSCSEIRTDGAQSKRSLKQAQAFAPSPYPEGDGLHIPLVPPSGGMPMVDKPYKKPVMSIGHCSKPFPEYLEGRCDLCRANPISQTSYKLNGKYNICSFCYSQMVVRPDVISCGGGDNTPTGTLFPSSYDPEVHSNTSTLFNGTPVTHKDQMYRSKTFLGQLGFCRCLVQDVTIPMGSRLAPNTPFRKIWAIKNNGTVRWPYGIKLRKTSSSYGFDTPWDVILETPLDGLAVNESISVSLDLKAPSFPGSYSAWYLLVTPTEIEFEERFSVTIEVVSKPRASKNATAINMKSGSLGSIASTKMHATDVKPTTDTETATVATKSKVSMSSHPPVKLGKGMAIVEGDEDLEETLVEVLLEMGYGDEDLNRKVLRSNNHDLGLARDALDCMSGDPLSDDCLMY